MSNKIILSILILLLFKQTEAQFLMYLINTSKNMGKCLLNIHNKYDHLNITGYMQPQWQVASDEVVSTYIGATFPSLSNTVLCSGGGE